jgi:hypothetical protein
MGAMGTSVGTLTSENSESPRYAPAVQKSSNFELRNEAGIGKSHKKHTISLAYVPDGQWQIVLSMGLREQGSSSSETRRGCPCSCCQGYRDLLNPGRRGQYHCPADARRVLILSIMVRSYLHREDLPRRVSQLLDLCLEVFQLTFTARGPHLSTNHITKQGKSYAKGGQGRQSRLPFLSSLTGGPKSRGVATPHPLATHPMAHRSLSPSTCFLVEGVLCLLPYRLHRCVGIMQLATATTGTLCKAASTMKR